MQQSPPSPSKFTRQKCFWRIGNRDVVSPVCQLIVSVVVAVGVGTLILGAFTVVEMLFWSPDWTINLTAYYHLRGLSAAIGVGLMVGWMVIRTSPALLAEYRGEVATDLDVLRKECFFLYCQWFVAMRWLTILIVSLLIYLSVNVFFLLPKAVLIPLSVTVAALALSNMGYTLALLKVRHARPLLVWQLYVDLLLQTLLLHFSGGAENPLAVFMLFHIIIGGILLSKRECYTIAATGSLLFAGVALGEWAGVIPHYPLGLFSHTGAHANTLWLPYGLTAITVHASTLFLAGYFVTSLSERLQHNEKSLSDLAEQALADHNLLQQALDTTRTGLRVLNTDLRPEWTNERWDAWFGKSRDQCRIFPDDTESPCFAAMCLKTGQREIHELEHVDAHKQRQVFQITSALLYGSQGQAQRVVQLAQDVTEQKESHERMIRAGQMAAVGELAGQVAHEVNNPIAIISAKGQLLLRNHRDEMSAGVSGELEKIVAYSKRVADIAQGLLSYSRPSPRTRIRVDVRQAIERSLAMIEHRATHRNIEVVNDLPGRPMPVIANEQEMEQVFLNLFINAVQAMPDGGTLRISAPEGREGVRVAVDDTGPGIPAGLRERILEPFFTTKADGQGTGLGLSICQGLLRSHQGSIHVEDRPEGGTRFLIHLPSPKSHPHASGARS